MSLQESTHFFLTKGKDKYILNIDHSQMNFGIILTEKELRQLLRQIKDRLQDGTE